VRVHYDEGAVTHTGPKPCAGPREGSGEALAGERAEGGGCPGRCCKSGMGAAPLSR
jgi:hypothetical protein